MFDKLHCIMLTHEAHVVSIVDVVWQLRVGKDEEVFGRRSLSKV